MNSSNYKQREDRLQEAKKAYIETKNVIKKRRWSQKCQKLPPVKSFAKTFNVNYRSLLQWIRGENSRSSQNRTNEWLNEHQYQTIFEYIDRLNQIEASSTLNMLQEITDRILQRNHQNPTVSSSKIGKNWPYRFVKKHPQYFRQKMKIMNPKRIDAERLSDLCTWFDELEMLIEAYSIQNEDIYNMNETGFRLDHERNENIISCFSSDRITVASMFNQILITVIECIGVNEKILSFFIIMPEKKQMTNW